MDAHVLAVTAPERSGRVVGRLVAEQSEAYLYAAPSYLERTGHPCTPEELAARGHVIGFDDTDTLKKGLHALGLMFGDESFPVRTENHLVQWELAKRGAGLCMMMAAVGDAEPRVRRALANAPAFTFPTWLTTHRELKTSRRMRVVFDLLAERLGSALSSQVASLLSQDPRRVST